MEHHFQTPALRAAILDDHRAVHAAIEAANPRAARIAMHRHLARVAKEFTRGFQLIGRRGRSRARTPSGGARSSARRVKVTR
jgi:hypothetical protein